MRLKISEVNFTSQHDWMFKLVNEQGINYFVMNEAFYKRHMQKSPITRKEIDHWDRGQWINATVSTLGGINVISYLNGHLG